MFCQYFFYISSKCIKHCNLFVRKYVCSISSNDLIFSLCKFSKQPKAIFKSSYEKIYLSLK